MKRRVLRVDDPIPCRIVRRINKFLVEVLLEGLSLTRNDVPPTQVVHKAHTNSTGRLEGYLKKGNVGYCFRSKGKKRKTEFELFAVKDGAMAAIIDTNLHTKTFENSLNMGLIPWLDGCRVLRRNVRVGNSIIDYLMGCDDGLIYLEMKSAVMRVGEGLRYASYPDCPSKRARRQIKDLMRCDGGRVLMFVAAIPSSIGVKINSDVDRELYKTISMARDGGVEMRGIGIHYNPKDSFVYLCDPDLRVYV